MKENGESIETLKKSCAALRGYNNTLKKENKSLNEKIEEQQNEISSLKKEVDENIAIAGGLLDKNDELNRIIAEKDEQIAVLTECVGKRGNVWWRRILGL